MTHRRLHPCRLASCPAASIKAVPAPCHCAPACRVRISHCRQSCPGTYVSMPSSCPSVGGLGDKSRIVQRMDHLPQPGHPQTAVLGKKRLGRRLVGGLPWTNVHRTNVTAMDKRAIALLFRQESRYRLRRLAKLSHSGRRGRVSAQAAVYNHARARRHRRRSMQAEAGRPHARILPVRKRAELIAKANRVQNRLPDDSHDALTRS